MYAHFEKLREEKKAMSREEKKKNQRRKEKEEEPYRTCYLNGRKELVGISVLNLQVYSVVGAHPKTGKLKRRVVPEQVTLNLGKDAKIPEPPAGHQWGD